MKTCKLFKIITYYDEIQLFTAINDSYYYLCLLIQDEDPIYITIIITKEMFDNINLNLKLYDLRHLFKNPINNELFFLGNKKNDIYNIHSYRSIIMEDDFPYEGFMI